jgi:hypothetical protein
MPDSSARVYRPEVRTHVAVCVLIVVGTVVAALRPTWLAAAPLGCVLRRFTGIRCPFCGMTTDFVAMWHGHMPRENPFSLLAAVAIYLLYPAFLLYTFRTGQLSLFSSRKMHVAILGIVCVMWAANNFLRFGR